MKVSFDAKLLKTALDAACVPLPKTDASKCVLFVVGDRTSLFTEHLGTTMNAHCDCLMETPGECLLPADKMKAVLAKAKTSVSLELKGDSCHINVGRDKHVFQVHDPSAFHKRIHDTSLPKIRVTIEDFKRLIDRTVHLCEESTMYATGGCLVERVGNDVIFTGLASKGVARQTCPLLDDSDDVALARPAIPASVLKFARSLGKSEDAVGISFTTNEVIFEYSDVSLCSQLMASRFPEIAVMLGRMADREIPAEVVPSELDEAVGKALTSASKDTRAVKLSFEDSAIEVTHASESATSTTYCAANYSAHPHSFMWMDCSCLQLWDR